MNPLAVFLALACGQEQASGPTGWTSEVVFEVPSRLSGCAVGELLPEHAGNEIAAVGADGAVYVAWREGGEWKSEKVYQAPGEAVQCVIGDADPRYPGNEIVCVGMAEGEEDYQLPGAAYVVWRADGAWHGEE
ncbi:MAG: hypothetical protein O7A09_08630, partial [Proteobacteria bacterium]|nr:hypothetical protein [Pseudomonadota bacterium]